VDTMLHEFPRWKRTFSTL